MSSDDLKSNYGRSISPKELADFLGIDRRTVIKYASLWGGVQVSPGCFRFFENRIKEIIDNAWFDSKKEPKAMAWPSHGKRHASSKAVSRRKYFLL